MKYSLVIPTYNEASVILLTVHTLVQIFDERLISDWEIIIADNASTDGTAEAVLSLRDTRVRVVRLAEKGKGRALRAGFATATGEIIGFTDADLSVPPEEIISAMKDVVAHPDLVVIGSRYHPQSVMPGREWWRIGSSRIFNILSRIIVGINVDDSQCPLKVMSKYNAQIFRATKENTWFADLEFLALLEHLSIPIQEVPVTWDEHRYPERRSKLSTIKDGFRSIVAMFRIRRCIPITLAEFTTVRK